MISCSKCKKATLPISDGGCIKTGGIVDVGCEYGEARIITNYDRIVGKSPEELVVWAAHITECHRCPARKEGCGFDCHKAWLDWLKQEAEE